MANASDANHASGSRTGAESLENGEAPWTQHLSAIFGDHRLDLSATDPAPAAVCPGERGLVRFWSIRHDRLRIIVEGPRLSRDRRAEILKTGSFLLLVVEAGAAEIELHNGTLRLTAGDATLVTAMEPFVFSSSAEFAGIWIELPIWWLIDLCQGRHMALRLRLAHERPTTSVLRTTIGLLLEDAQDPQAFDELIDLFGHVLARILVAAPLAAGHRERPSERIQRFIGQHYRQSGLTAADAARALGCSVSSIHKTCAAAGQTFGGRLLLWRLSVAAYRLARSNQSVSEIAFDCGFVSLPHFCRVFKSRYGFTPANSRRSLSFRSY